MAKLEELLPGTTIRGLTPDGRASVIQAKFRAPDILSLVYENDAGNLHRELLYRTDEGRLEIVTETRTWRFDADGNLLKLVSEAQRIRWAHLFDPYLAVHTSVLDPLPHQITAVYETMLLRQPLRFLLADDPGSGKTIMAGLLIKELLIRGALDRCLIVCPGSLVEQWQDELYRRFQLPFEILTNDRIGTARTGNVFNEMPLMIGRLDKLARDEALHPLLDDVEWDLIVVDEAHKMSATFFGGEIKYTQRYRLGQRLSKTTRNFLLMTATPHNGKEEDFQLFMALIDPDRFAGRFRQGVHQTDVSDLMRRMVKEQLLKFDSRPLFPERRAYSVPYELSPLEAELYERVTEYVREEFNRADQLEDTGRRGTVGFALMILQRRLASSPEAIYQSLRRRRERLEARLEEMQRIASGLGPSSVAQPAVVDQETFDDEDYLAEELEELEEEVVDQATAARTVEELRIEIDILGQLEQLAQQVRQSKTDRKWEQLSGLLQEQQEMFDANGNRRKLVIFTEHKDTLFYLTDRIRTLLGRPEAVVIIHGGVQRKARLKAQESFVNDKNVLVLVATDAAGEGINLHRAHLMVNYDLPWNPNRLEQRFGRIHRIGQTEVCHLWNLVAEETREGYVYSTLLRKLDQASQTLGGAVFPVLGRAIEARELRNLMIEAVRYGDRPDVRARVHQTVDGALDRERLEELLAERALTHDFMAVTRVQEIRQHMERMEARRLQPFYIASFFSAAFEHFGGRLRQRETGRYEITHVPALIRQQARRTGYGDPVATRYERICFEKENVRPEGMSEAAFITPGHPLLDALIDLLLERHREVLKQGAVLVDGEDLSQTPRMLSYLEHTIKDGRPDASGQRRVVSRRFQFVERRLTDLGDGQDLYSVTESRPAYNAGPAPYLDYRALTPEEWALVQPVLDQLVGSVSFEDKAITYAVESMVRPHMDEVRAIRDPLIRKTKAAVKERLTAEIAYWDYRAQQLKAQEQAGRPNARLNSARARQRAEEMNLRLQQRTAELEQERTLSALEPIVVGGVLIFPEGLLAKSKGASPEELLQFSHDAAARRRVEMAAMDAVIEAERRLGNDTLDVSRENCGYDVLSITPDGEQRFIEVKGRHQDATTVTVTHNEILTALNKPENWFLAIVLVSDTDRSEDPSLADARGTYTVLRYVNQPFDSVPDSLALSSNFDLRSLWDRGSELSMSFHQTTPYVKAED